MDSGVYEKIKLDRCRYYERDWISLITKKEVAKKTNGKCAICGKRIRVGDKDFTIDHFIPLNKGGSNEVENLIPLCEDCNKEKDDDVTKVHYKYPYLKDKHIKELDKLTNRFIKEYNYITSNNILTYDDQNVRLPVFGLQSNVNGKKRTYNVYTTMQIKKAKELTDDILKFVTEYNDYYGYGSDYIEDLLKETIEMGRLYTVTKDKEDDIRYILYFRTSNLTYTSSKGEESEPFEVVSIGNIVTKPGKDREDPWARAILIDVALNDLVHSAMTLEIRAFSVIIETDIISERDHREFKYQLSRFVGEPDSISGEEKVGEFVALLFSLELPSKEPKLSELTDEEHDEVVLHDRKIWSDRLKIGRITKDEED